MESRHETFSSCQFLVVAHSVGRRPRKPSLSVSQSAVISQQSSLQVCRRSQRATHGDRRRPEARRGAVWCRRVTGYNTGAARAAPDTRPPRFQAFSPVDKIPARHRHTRGAPSPAVRVIFQADGRSVGEGDHRATLHLIRGRWPEELTPSDSVSARALGWAGAASPRRQRRHAPGPSAGTEAAVSAGAAPHNSHANF